MMALKLQATNKKAVLVTMYVEKPRRLLGANGHRHHHHHHHHSHRVHHTIKREVIHYTHDGDAGKRYINRRAELLQYSQLLRKSARQPAFSPLVSKQNSLNHQQTMSQVPPLILFLYFERMIVYGTQLKSDNMAYNGSMLR